MYGVRGGFRVGVVVELTRNDDEPSEIYHQECQGDEDASRWVFHCANVAVFGMVARQVKAEDAWVLGESMYRAYGAYDAVFTNVKLVPLHFQLLLV